MTAPECISPDELRIESLERSETIPSSWYVSPEMHEFEKEAIFAKYWHALGHSSRLSRPGDQVLGEVAGSPVILVKGEDEIVRAFYNVCRHRGGPIAIADGCAQHVMQCKYHGWTYMFDGSLRGVPRFDRVELFDKKDFGLVPVAYAEWEGMHFVQLERSAAVPSLTALMRGIRERLGSAKIGKMKFARRVVYDVKCNWKVYVDNYLEGYHLPFVHPELCNLLDIGSYVTQTFDWHSLQFSPLDPKENIYSKSGGEALYYFVFPNLMLNILPGRLQTNIVVPVSHNACRVIFDYYYDEVESVSAKTRIEDDLAYSDKVQAEDIEICEYVQRGLQSRAYTKGRFSVECEEGVYHFQTLLKKAFQAAIGSKQ